MTETQVIKNLQSNLIKTADNLQSNLIKTADNLESNLIKTADNLESNLQINKNKIKITFTNHGDSERDDDSWKSTIIDNQQTNHQGFNISNDNNYIRHINWTRTELNDITSSYGKFSILDLKNNDNYVIAEILRSSYVDKKDNLSSNETNLKYYIIESGGIFKGFSIINVFLYGKLDSNPAVTKYRDYTFS